MDKQETVTADSTQWSIDLDWYQQHNRSFQKLVENYVCPKCRKKLGDISQTPAKKLFSTIKGCCSDTPEFISHRLPILENIFRLFLSNGNQPLTIDEIRDKLLDKLGDTYRTSLDILSRLLNKDKYYGLRPVTEKAD